jgi:hypothetical protein
LKVFVWVGDEELSVDLEAVEAPKRKPVVGFKMQYLTLDSE